MLNRIILIGRLTRDPELRYTPSGSAVASFTLAVDRAYKNADGEQETDFIDITVWRKQAEACNVYLCKGKLAAVDGSLRIDNFTDKDGNKRKAAKVTADSVRFLSPRGDDQRESNTPFGGYDSGGMGALSPVLMQEGKKQDDCQAYEYLEADLPF